MRLRRLRLIIIGLLLLASAATVSARQVLQADLCHVEADDVVSGTLLVLCRTLIVDGIVDGNLIGAATNTQINGEVTEGIYMIGGQIDVSGTLGDDVHFFGVVLNFLPGATLADDTDLFALSMSITQSEEVVIAGSIINLGYQLLLEGDVGGEISFFGSTLELGGTVSQDVYASVGDSEDLDGAAQLETIFIPLPVELSLSNPGLRIQRGAEIQGTLAYRAAQEAIILGELKNDPVFVQVQFQQSIDISDEEGIRQSLETYGGSMFREFTTLSVVGALGLLFIPGVTQLPISNLRRRPLTSLGVGTLAFILSFPVVVISVVLSVLILFLIALLGLGNLVVPGTVILGLMNIGGASLFYFVAIFFARSILCLAIGRRVLRIVIEDDGSSRFLYLSLALGALLIALVVSLPFIGWIFNAFVLFIGLGAIISLVQAELRTLRENVLFSPGTFVPATDPGFGSRRSFERSPPRPLPPRTGTEDLPTGFTWWDEDD